MNRADWEGLAIDLVHDTPVPLNEPTLSQMPFLRVTTTTGFLGAVAKKTPEKVEVSIYRRDPKDEPTPINVDRYIIWQRIPPHLDVSEMVQTAATGVNRNFIRYCEESVFIVKEKPGPGHWLPTLPPEVSRFPDKAT
jgi:hypothetical protein